jgi:hypothetical protein
MQPLAVAEDLDAAGHGEPRTGPVGGRPAGDASRFFKAAKKLSAAALSQHTPVLPTLVRMSWAWQNRANPGGGVLPMTAVADQAEREALLDPAAGGEGVNTAWSR